MRLSSCFGPPISIEEQPSGDLLAPVRDINDLSIVSKAWWTVHLPLDDARRPDVPATVGRPYSGHRSLRSPPLCNVRAPRARAHQRRPRDRGRGVFFACDQAFHVAERGHVALLRHHGAHRRRRCNTGTGFRSTCGRFSPATRSWCVRQRSAWSFMSTVGCCITLVTPPVP